MKKVLCLILCVAMLVSVFAGCGTTEPEETTTAATTLPNETTASATSAEATTEATTTEATTAPATETTTPDTTSVITETTLGTVIMTRTEATTADTTEPPRTTEATTAATTTEATTEATTTEATTAESTTTEATTTAAATEPPPSNITGAVETINGVLTVGDCAMEYFYASYDGLRNYAGYVNTLQSYLPNVNFYAMFIPIAISMYCPEGVSPGSNQQTVMNDWYAMMPGVTGVDTFSSLYAHRDEYLYFRTDTHWTQRGGYYAYTAFCNAAGFSANPLSAYQYASSTGYLGYMYVILKGTSVGNLMSANPDTVEKFKPVSSLSATGYYDPSMTGGYGVSVVNMDSGNYYAFTGGDQPLIHIKNSSVSNGRIAIVTKDSYGNTLVPFLADCFQEVYVIDQRHFNTDNTYSLNIVSFAQTHGVTDFIIEANAFNASAASSNFGRMLP